MKLHIVILPLFFCFFLLFLAPASFSKNIFDISNLHIESPSNQDDSILDLDQLISIALHYNQTIESVKQQLAQKKGSLIKDRSGYLPHLSVRGDYRYTERKDSAAQDAYEDADVVVYSDAGTEKDDVSHGSVNLSQLVYDFGKTTSAIKAGKANTEASQANLQRQIQYIIFQVKKEYYRVLEKKKLIEVAQESVKSFQQHLDRAEMYHKTGMRTRIDVINAEVELSNANMRLLRAQYDLRLARVALEKALGVKPYNGNYALLEQPVNIDNVLESMPPVAQSLDALIEHAYKRRPDLIQSQKITEAAQAKYKEAKGDYWPSITMEANYDDYDTDLSLYKDSWDVGMACNWELFSGLHTKGAVAEALGVMLEEKAKLQSLELDVGKEVTESYLKTDENRESVQIALQTLSLAKENLALAEKRYETGAYDVIEFNDAQLSLTKTRSELVVTYYGYLTALAAIEYAVGDAI